MSQIRGTKKLPAALKYLENAGLDTLSGRNAGYDPPLAAAVKTPVCPTHFTNLTSAMTAQQHLIGSHRV